MALLVLILIVLGLFVIQRFGAFRDHPITWDLTWRIFLNILTWFGVLTVVVKLWSVGVVSFHLDNRFMVSPTKNIPVDLASTIVLALGLIGVWRRRKWSAWVVMGRLVFTIALQLVFYRSLGWDMFRGYSGEDNVVADVVGLVMWAWAFNRTWSHFGHSDYGKHAKARAAEQDVENAIP